MTCVWTKDDHPLAPHHATSCGEGFIFTEGNAKENEFKYCPYCGEEIEEVSEDE